MMLKTAKAGFSTQARTFDPTTAKTTVHAACVFCRTQKVRCDGEKSGCQRCKGQGRKCKYVEVARQKKLSHTSSSKDQENTEIQKQSSSSASSMSSLLPNSTLHNEEKQPQQPQHPQQEQEQQQHQQQQQQQHEDLTWLMSQPPDIGFFADFDMQEDAGSTTDPSSAFLNISSPILDDTSRLHQVYLPPAMPLDAAEDQTEYTTKSHGSNAAACQCLYRIVMVMDQLDSQDDCALEKSLNNMLVLHKEVLSHSTTMLGCMACTMRLENMMIVAMLLNTLARRYQRIVHVPGDSTRPSPALSLGDYKVDSTEEYVALVYSLLGVQLRRLQTLAHDLQNISSRFHSETLSCRLTACMGVVSTSLDALRSVGGWT
ncbi:hypothetical protein F5Y16DRAFT_252233 [Xylariaceae sp. FL0255]|nr:hypothetical protein F5Y16DRAFT_252233 [Xylariaceae sp. FL0255]